MTIRARKLILAFMVLSAMLNNPTVSHAAMAAEKQAHHPQTVPVGAVGGLVGVACRSGQRATAIRSLSALGIIGCKSTPGPTGF